MTLTVQIPGSGMVIPADLPSPVGQLRGVPFDCRADCGRWFETEAYVLYREKSEIFAHYADRCLNEIPAGLGRWSRLSSLRGVNVDERNIGRRTLGRRMRMSCRGQRSKYSNETQHTKAEKKFRQGCCVASARIAVRSGSRGVR